MKTNALKKLLEQYLSEGKFDNAFIADENGLTLVCAGPDTESAETQAAVFARIKQSIAMVQDQNGLNAVNEMIFHVAGKKRIICKNFSIRQQKFSLAVTMDTSCRYKRLTNVLIHQLDSIWDI